MLMGDREEFESYINSQKAKMEPPTREQLIMLATSSAVPFVGFGFMDNAIMILAGEVRCRWMFLCVHVRVRARVRVLRVVEQ
jgi:hypothetical protein